MGAWVGGVSLSSGIQSTLPGAILPLPSSDKPLLCVSPHSSAVRARLLTFTYSELSELARNSGKLVNMTRHTWTMTTIMD